MTRVTIINQILMNKQTIIIGIIPLLILSGCNQSNLAGDTPDVLKPVIVTEKVQFDTDDPAIWIHPQDSAQSLVVGTDKANGGGIYAFNLRGKIVNKVTGLVYPNNIDVAYGLFVGNKSADIAVATERNAHTIRVLSLPDLKFIDNGGIPVFEGETGKGFRDGMGLALYTASDGAIYAIVGRKSGTSGEYLWQYRLAGTKNGSVTAFLVRKFGLFSGKKEIESIAVDHQLGYLYYSDEQTGIRKYYADPVKGNEELALFGEGEFKSDIEGISIFQTSKTTGYIIVSNQQDNSFNVYAREGDSGNSHQHTLLARIPMSTIESDGSDVTHLRLNDLFPNGLFVAMSNGKVFHYYDWRHIEKWILQNKI